MAEDFHLQLLLETGVPLVIHDIQHKGGVDAQDWAFLREFGPLLGEHGEALLYRDKKYTTTMAEGLIRAVAILSFVPGGVHVFGLHFETREEEET